MTELKKLLSIYLDLYLHQIIISGARTKEGRPRYGFARNYEGQTVFSVYKHCGYQGNS